MSTMSTEPLQSISAAARAVGLPRHTLARLVKRQRVPSITVGGLVRVRLSDVRAAIREVPAIV